MAKDLKAAVPSRSGYLMTDPGFTLGTSPKHHSYIQMKPST